VIRRAVLLADEAIDEGHLGVLKTSNLPAGLPGPRMSRTTGSLKELTRRP
jgi:hypothetical protein